MGLHHNRTLTETTLGLFHIAFVLAAYAANCSAISYSKFPLERGFANIPFVSSANLDQFRVWPEDQAGAIDRFCKRVSEEFQRYGWKDAPCGETKWRTEYKTRLGNPLIYAEFGEGKKVTTLFLGGVHPDEMTPLPIAFRLARYLTKHPQVHQKADVKVIVAPLVNPDGFLLKKPLRTNPEVDVNRNFLTLDWYDKAIDSWRRRRGGQGRYFPGYFPHTEIETLFQVQLIDDFHPNKILSIHAPLGFLDYDGPGDQKPRFLTQAERKAKDLVRTIAEKSRNYRVVDYSFYPGSLGNFAGNERNVPTITLELETTDPRRVPSYWKQFLPGFLQSIRFPFEQPPADAQKISILRAQ